MEIIYYFCIAIRFVFNLIILLAVVIGISMLHRKINLNLITKKVLWKISFAFVVLTPFIIPVKVIDKSQFEMLTFGFPFGFVEQHTRNAVVNKSFPFITTIVNPWGHSIMSNLNIRIDQFIISAVSVYVILYIISYFAKGLWTIND